MDVVASVKPKSVRAVGFLRASLALALLSKGATKGIASADCAGLHINSAMYIIAHVNSAMCIIAHDTDFKVGGMLYDSDEWYVLVM